jgi:hypothetical protein
MDVDEVHLEEPGRVRRSVLPTEGKYSTNWRNIDRVSKKKGIKPCFQVSLDSDENSCEAPTMRRSIMHKET